MGYQVSVTDVAARPTAVVCAATTWQEIYGPHRDDPAELTTEVYWLLS